jgi:hypothetical protein
MARIFKGERWAALTCLDITQESRSISIGKYDGFSTVLVTVYRLRCDCSAEVTVLAQEFPGKRRMTDCGCGRTRQEEFDKGMTSYMLSGECRKIIQEYSRLHFCSKTEAVEQLVRAGWCAELS